MGASLAYNLSKKFGDTLLEEGFKVNKTVGDNIGLIDHKDIVKSVEIQSCWISYK